MVTAAIPVTGFVPAGYRWKVMELRHVRGLE
jgi:hypothetical protein